MCNRLSEGEGDGSLPGDALGKDPLEVLSGFGGVECGCWEGLDNEELEEVLSHGLPSWRVLGGERGKVGWAVEICLESKSILANIFLIDY